MTGGLFPPAGVVDRYGITWTPEHTPDVNPFLAANHYLGPLNSATMTVSGYAGGELGTSVGIAKSDTRIPR